MPEYLQLACGIAGGAITAWVGIRVDIARMKLKVAHLEHAVFGEVLP